MVLNFLITYYFYYYLNLFCIVTLKSFSFLGFDLKIIQLKYNFFILHFIYYYQFQIVYVKMNYYENHIKILLIIIIYLLGNLLYYY
jgi:hypothetical protein